MVLNRQFMALCLLLGHIYSARGQSNSIAFDTTGKLTQLTIHSSKSLPIFPLAGPLVLPARSLNNITGSWKPAVIDLTKAGTVTCQFTPDPGQHAEVVRIDVKVLSNNTPIFNLKAIDTLLTGTTGPDLPAKSVNGYTGTWNPAKINAGAPGGPSVYTFTANNAGIPPFSVNIVVIDRYPVRLAAIGTVYVHEPAPLLPTTSQNGITGSWLPATVNTILANTTQYEFTPDAGQQADPVDITIEVKDPITPTFDPIGVLLQNSVAPALLGISKEGIKGAWHPAVISTDRLAPQEYVFSPDAGQHAAKTTLRINIAEKVTPDFPTSLTLLTMAPPPILKSTSPNGIMGTWAPDRITTDVAGLQHYIFTPIPGQAATGPVTMTVTVADDTRATFAPIGPIFENDAPPTLPGRSLENISGTWLPAVVNLALGPTDYTFTPTLAGAKPTTTITITVKPRITPSFAPIGPVIQQPASDKNFIARDAAIKKSARTILQKQINSTLEVLDPDNGDSVRVFANALWGTDQVQKMSDDLNELNRMLANNDASSITPLSVFQPILAPLRAYLLNSSGSVYSLQPATTPGTKVELHRAAVFNKFIQDVYNGAGTLPSKPTIKVNDYIKSIHYLQRQLKISDALAKDYNAADIDPAVALKMRSFNQSVSNPDSTFSFVKHLLNKDWFKYWFWIRGGLLRLNPLDYSTDNFLATTPRYVLNDNGDIFDEYIDSVIRKYMLYDTTGKVDAFKKILALRGSGKALYGLKARLDTLTKVNAASLATFAFSDQILNSVEIPARGGEEAKEDYYSYSVSNGFKTDDNDNDYLSNPIKTGSSKTIVVFNVPAGAKIYLKEKTKIITDQSSFQAEEGTIADLLVQAATIITSVSSPLGVITGLLPAAAKSPVPVIKQLNAITPAAFSPAEFEISAFPHCTVADFPAWLLSYRRIYMKKIYDQVMIPTTIKNDNRQIGSLTTAADGPKILTLKLIIKNYTQLYEEYTGYIEEFNHNRILLSGMSEIFTHSTLPADLAATTQTPLLSTKILTTSATDTTVQDNDTLYVIKGIDSTRLGQFNYKVGKTYRLQLSAGLSYLVFDYVQSKATVSGNQVTVDNKAQQYRFVIGMHVYLGKGLFPQDNRFLGHFWDRSSIFAGVGLPNPLENLYLGYSYDLFPGLKVVGGAYFYRNDKYTIQNNQLLEDRLRYKATGPFFAIQLDPTSLIKSLGIFSK